MRTKALLHLTGRTEMLLTEWVPIGPNNFSFLAERLECGARDRECILASDIDPARNSAVTSIRGDDTLTLKVVDFEDMEFVRFEARPRYDAPGVERKEKVIGVDMSRSGRVRHGMRLLSRDDRPCRYSVDDLALIAADLVTDTSRIMDAILNPYQRQMLNVVFGEGTIHRDKFLVVQAEAVEPALAGVKDVLDNDGYRAELQQILGPLEDRRCFDTGDGGMVVTGDDGLLMIGGDPETYGKLVSFSALMGCINGLQDNILSKVWRSWDVLKEQKHAVLTEGVKKIDEIQWVLSGLSADVNFIDSVPNYLERTLANAEAFFQKELSSADGRAGEFIRKMDSERRVKKAKERLADTVKVVADLGTEIGNVRLLASALIEKETAGINRAMNILTVVSVIILPLSLMTGWYGMNFQKYCPADGSEIGPLNMPELYWRYSYLVCICVAIAIVISMSYFFYRQGLLGRRKRAASEGAPSIGNRMGA